MLKRLLLYVPLILMPVVFVVYGFEIYLWRGLDDQRQIAAAEAGYRLDPRDKKTFIDDSRARGVAMVAYVPPEALFRRDGKRVRSRFAGPDARHDLFTLAGVSKVRNVVCNEAGQWFHYAADRHGFNNPDALWDNDRQDIVVLGDSFALGNCVLAGRGMTDRLRTAYPRTLNLGAGGNGPLFMLASLREYGARFRPRIVLWMFYDNDFDNLANERRSAALRAYLDDPAFSQGLAGRQAEIDRRLRALGDRVGGQAGWRDIHALRVLRLQMLRTRLAPPPPASTAADAVTTGLFRQTLQAAKRTAAGWGGRVIVVYLPPPARYFAPPRGWAEAFERRRKRVQSAAHDLGLRLIDLQPAFDSAPRPRRLAFGPVSHYSEPGYALAAKTVIGALGPLSAN